MFSFSTIGGIVYLCILFVISYKVAETCHSRAQSKTKDNCCADCTSFSFYVHYRSQLYVLTA